MTAAPAKILVADDEPAIRKLLRLGLMPHGYALLEADTGARALELLEQKPDKEYDLLRLLVQHAGKVLTHKFLLRELWQDPPDPQYLRVYVQHLRRKIEKDPQRPRLLFTETGIGYRLRAPEAEH